MLGVNFAGTAVMESEGRRLQVNGGSEIDIANGILRVSQSATQRVCFLDGHGEPDPFSLESHDHLEGAPGHSHGLGAKYVLHERARDGQGPQRAGDPELQGGEGPPPAERATGSPAARCWSWRARRCRCCRSRWTRSRRTSPRAATRCSCSTRSCAPASSRCIREYGIVVDDDIVIDEASHFWADVSVTGGQRLQPASGHARPAAHLLPGGAVAVADAPARSRHLGGPARQLLEEQLGAGEPGPRRLRRRAGTAGTEHADGGRAAAARLLRGRPAPEGPRSRIAVVGDSDFATNSFFHIMGNGTLFLNTVNYLGAQENLIGIQPRTADLPRINLTNRQMKGRLLPLGDPRPRAARGGGDRGVVEAALSPVPRRAGLVAVWVLLAGARGGHRGARVDGPASGEVRGARRPTRACWCRCRWASSGRSRSRTREGSTASSATRPAPGSTTALTASPRAPTRTSPIRRCRSASRARSPRSVGRASSATSRSDATAAPPTVLPLPSWSSSSTAPASRSRSCSTPSATSRLTR